jgi:hypothetical protein
MLSFFLQHQTTKAKLFATRKLSAFFSIWHQTISNRPAGGCECASHRDATRRTPIINRASAAGNSRARAPKRNKTKLLIRATTKIKRFRQQIVAKVLRARRLNFLSALSKEGGKLAASKKQKAKRVHSLQREDFTSGKVEEFIYFGNSLQICTSICTSFKTIF